MMPALLIAGLALVEAVRRQIYMITIFLAVLLFALPMLVNVFGLGASERVVKDVALTTSGLYGVVLALFLGSVSVPTDIERRTAFPLLARPVTRTTYLWGKWLGLMTFIAASMAFLVATVMVSSAVFLGNVDARLLLGAAAYLLEDAVLASVCLWVSTFASPPMAGVFGAFAYIVGGLPSAFVKAFLYADGQRTPSALVAELLKGCLPNFQLFHVKDAIVHGDPIQAGYLWAVLVYGVAWVLLLQVMASWTFGERDL